MNFFHSITMICSVSMIFTTLTMDNFELLCREIDNGNIPKIKELIEADKSLINQRGPSQGRTPFLLAAAGRTGDKSLEILQLLADHGADVNATDSDKYNALHWVRGKNVAALVGFLVGKGVDLEARERFGQTPLCKAVFCTEGIEKIRALLQHEAGVNTQNDRGRTALYYAALFGNVEVMNALLESGADVNEVTFFKRI